MEKNNINMELYYDKDRNDKPFIVIIVILVIICIGCGIYAYINNSKNEVPLVNNETEKIIEDNTTPVDLLENETIEESNVTEIDNTEEEPDEKELLTEKDKDYEYTYYSGEEDESEAEVKSFKINNKDVIDDIGFTSEISRVTKYKDFLAIETYYAATCGPSHNDLFIFDYKGNLLFKSGYISNEDLNRIKNDDPDEKWEIGYLTFDDYSYNETSKKLEVKYEFNINTVIGDCVQDTKKKFCEASKTKTLYSSITITTKLNNGKFTEENISDKKEFNVDDLDDSDRPLYNEECGESKN